MSVHLIILFVLFSFLLKAQDPKITQVCSYDNHELLVKLKTSVDSLKIAYSLNGLDPHPDSNLYSIPFVYPKGAQLKVVSVVDGRYVGKIDSMNFLVHLGMGKNVNFLTKSSDRYSVGLKNATLTNAIGSTNKYTDGEWLGFEGNDAEFIVDLGDDTLVTRVTMNFFNAVNDGVHHSNEVVVLGSVDGKSFSVIGVNKTEAIDSSIVPVVVKIASESADNKVRFVKVVAKNKIIPFGFKGEGSPAWLFMDEVIIE